MTKKRGEMGGGRGGEGEKGGANVRAKFYGNGRKKRGKKAAENYKGGGQEPLIYLGTGGEGGKRGGSKTAG